MEYGNLQLGFERTSTTAKVTPDTFESFTAALQAGDNDGWYTLEAEHGSALVKLDDVLFVKWDFKPASEGIGFGIVGKSNS